MILESATVVSLLYGTGSDETSEGSSVSICVEGIG